MWGLIALAVVVVGGLAFTILRSRRAWTTRDHLVRAWADRIGAEYVAGPVEATTLADLASLSKSQTVTSSEAVHIVTIGGGAAITVFDLHRVTKHVRSSGTRFRNRFDTCALFHSDRRLPSFAFAALSGARPGSVEATLLGGVKSLAALRGASPAGKPIPLERHPGFLLTGSDAAALRDLFSTSLLSFFEERLGWTAEGNGSPLLVGFNPRLRQGWSRPPLGDLIAAGDLDKFVAGAKAVAKRLEADA